VQPGEGDNRWRDFMAEEKDDPAAVLAALPRHARLLGIDLGTKTLGLALSDVERRIASPLETLERSKFTADAKKIQALVARFGIGAIVFGLPLNMDGTEGPRAQATRAFARNLAAHIRLPTLFWDERLSTAAVNRMLIDFDTTRRRRAALVDKMAAAYILQGALDRYERIRPGEESDDDLAE
jgi:putative Holliday junction resolvase